MSPSPQDRSADRKRRFERSRNAGHWHGNGREVLHQLLLTVGEDLHQVGFDEVPMNQGSKAWDIVNSILGQSLIRTEGLKSVLVIPNFIRPPKLLIHETIGRLPGFDLSSPLDRQSVKLQPVVDQSTLLHFDWRRSDNLKFQPRRRDRLKVTSIGKEAKNLFERTVNYEISGQHKAPRLMGLDIYLWLRHLLLQIL